MDSQQAAVLRRAHRTGRRKRLRAMARAAASASGWCSPSGRLPDPRPSWHARRATPHRGAVSNSSRPRSSHLGMSRSGPVRSRQPADRPLPGGAPGPRVRGIEIAMPWTEDLILIGHDVGTKAIMEPKLLNLLGASFALAAAIALALFGSSASGFHPRAPVPPTASTPPATALPFERRGASGTELPAPRPPFDETPITPAETAGAPAGD